MSGGLIQQQQPDIAGNYLSGLRNAQQAQIQQQQAAQQAQSFSQQNTQFQQGQQDRTQRQSQAALGVLGPLVSQLGDDDPQGRARVRAAASSLQIPEETLARFDGVSNADLKQMFANSAQGRAAATQAQNSQLTGARIDETKAHTSYYNERAVNGGRSAKADQFSSPTMIDVRGPDVTGQDGKVTPGAMTTSLAQQNKTTGQWVSADERHTPLGSPEGVTPPGGSGRFQVQAGRVMAAAEDVLRTVKTINAMPITASTGMFGMANAKTSFLGAPLNFLRQEMSNQQVQTYNALAQGLARSVVSIENQGLAPSEGQIASAAAQLLVQPGDSYLTRIQKQAEFRQHTEAHLEPMLHGTMTTPEQKVYIRKIIADLKEAIPYTVQDIVEYSSKPGEMRFGDYARSTVLKPKPQGAAAPSNVVQEYVPGGPPAGAQPPAAGGVNFIFGADGKLVPAR